MKAGRNCLICGRRPVGAYHFRFAQSRALGRKVSDEFTVPLCRGHHREVHRCGDEAAWWRKAGIDTHAVEFISSVSSPRLRKMGIFQILRREFGEVRPRPHGNWEFRRKAGHKKPTFAGLFFDEK